MSAGFCAVTEIWLHLHIPVLHHLHNLSLRGERVPVLWKASCLAPVPKKLTSSDPKDYQSVALTLHVMKVLERLVLANLRLLVKDMLDPLQFAYQPQGGVGDSHLPAAAFPFTPG